MITIRAGNEDVTVVNVFKVKGDQDEAVARLRAVNHRIAREPGFVAVAVHRSLDGTRVANYAQWRSEGEIRAALGQPDVRPLLARLAEVGEGDWHLYEVVAADAA